MDADRRIREFARKHGCAERIIFTPFIDADPRRLLTLMGAIDYFLDCWKYNALTLFLQYLYAGALVLTLQGQTVASRVGASLLTAHGFPQYIKTTRDEWKEYAIMLGSPDRRAELVKLKEEMRIARDSSTVFADSTDYAQQVVAGLRAALEANCKTLPAQHKDVSVYDLAKSHEQMHLITHVQGCEATSVEELDSLVAEIESLRILENHGVDQEELGSILLMMSQLGYISLKFVQGSPTDSSRLTLAGQFRHSSVTIRINKSSDTARLAIEDSAVHGAYFHMKRSSEFGAVITETHLSHDENASPADVIRLIPRSGSHFSISTTLRGHFLTMETL